MIEHGKGMLQRIGFTREVLKEEIYWIPAKETATPVAVTRSSALRGSEENQHDQFFSNVVEAMFHFRRHKNHAALH